MLSINGRLYSFMITGCGQAVTIYDSTGRKMTSVPYESGWEKTAEAAVRAIQRQDEAQEQETCLQV